MEGLPRLPPFPPLVRLPPACPPVAVHRMLPSFAVRLFPADGFGACCFHSKNIQCMGIIFKKIK